ncbi:MAG: sigma-54-dependent Fis family transcriptional regulator [Myxococcales bacterium]|nr:sigma-54-dependent Fis family transcriptional regulator [Myxococcales bacterium]
MTAPALIICAQDLEDAGRQLARVSAGAMVVHLVLTDWSPDRRAMAIVRVGHQVAEVHTPGSLAELSRLPVVERPARLAAWISDALVHRTLRRDDTRRAVALLWRADWPAFVAAGSAVVTADDEVSWWSPEEGPWTPLLPRGRLLARSLAPRPAGDALSRLIGSSPAMQALRERIRRRASLPFPVLVVGESGTGKALVAEALHALSGRRGRLVTVSGELLAPSTAEAELFGHTKDAFAEARHARQGAIREAEQGTLFINEIAATPLRLRARLLGALGRVEEGTLAVQPVGSERPPVDVPVRLIAATRADPLAEATLSPDLYYRLAGLRFDLPPLRARGDDLFELAAAYLGELGARVGDGPTVLTEAARARLRRHRWPGNVRELHLVLRDAWLTARDEGRPSIDARDLTLETTAPGEAAPEIRRAPLSIEVARFVVAACDLALQTCGGDRSRAALAMGLKSAREFDRYRALHARRLDD